MDHSSEAYLATPNPEGGWKHLYMNSFLPKEQRDESLMMAGGIAFKGNGQPVIVSPVVNLEDGKQYWGHVTTKLVRFDSEDGGATFTGKLIGHTTPSSPQWMPNLERPNGFNDVPANPSLIYTDGECGVGCDNMVQNKVLWTVLD